MDIIYILIIIIILAIILFCVYKGVKESFGIGCLNGGQECNAFSKGKFMLRDLRTKLWLNVANDGMAKFLPGGFGVPLLMSKNPTEYLPLRLLSSPNDYLLASYDQKAIRIVSNPYSEFEKLELLIYGQNRVNIIGYKVESGDYKYIYVDDKGFVNSVDEPSKASAIEFLNLDKI